MPKGPKGEKRPADVIGAITVAKIATGVDRPHRIHPSSRALAFAARHAKRGRGLAHKSRLVSSGWSMSALPPKADMRQRIEHVCFVP